jgi:hypothetical protein
MIFGALALVIVDRLFSYNRLRTSAPHVLLVSALPPGKPVSLSLLLPNKDDRFSLASITRPCVTVARFCLKCAQSQGVLQQVDIVAVVTVQTAVISRAD